MESVASPPIKSGFSKSEAGTTTTCKIETYWAFVDVASLRLLHVCVGRSFVRKVILSPELFCPVWIDVIIRDRIANSTEIIRLRGETRDLIPILK